MKFRPMLASAIAVLGLAVSLVAFGNTQGAVAANGSALILGSTFNSATNPTFLDDPGCTNTCVNNGIAALEVDHEATANDVNPIGIYGTADGVGVQGFTSGPTNGVEGHANNSIGSGVYGQNAGAGYGVSGQGSIGVNGTGSSYGVKGQGLIGILGNTTGAGDGVDGTANNSCCSAVYGLNSGLGNGVAGRADAGTGVLAASTGGVALKVSGTAQFSRSGLVSIAYPNKSEILSVPGGLTASSLVFAMVQDNTGVYVKSAVPNPSNGSVQINLNKAAGSGTNPKTAHVAWFVVN